MNFLASLLASDHPLFARTIAEFEKASGNSGVDTRLVASITENAHSVMRAINIDPSDTSAEELYHALATIVESGNLLLLANTQYVLLPFPDGPVSFNLLDVIENAHHQLPFEKRSRGHAQRNLRLEIIKRYADHDRTSDELVHHLAELAGLKTETDAHYSHVDETVADANAAKPPSVLMIGDIFTDAFIKLSEDVVKVEKDESGNNWVKIPFGGRPPYDEVEIVQSVGPAPNAAVSCARLGLDVTLMTWLGDDKAGDDSMATLKNELIHTELIKQKQNTKSNYYYVLRVGAERTILTKDEAYDYNWIEPKQAPDWIYLASSSEDSWQLHLDLMDYLAKNPGIKLVFQPGTFHFVWGHEKLKAIYEQTDLFILNKEEAAQMTGLDADSDIATLFKASHELGPKRVVITDGPNGAYASYDGKIVLMPNYPDPAPPYDRTGAGDAFASTIVAAVALGKSMEEALSWAPINSMSVVQKLGAQAGLLNQSDIQNYLKDAPENYTITNL